jgi:hypothetical protein
VEIGAANIVVCGPSCEAEARARVLLRIHGSLSVAFRQALHDWQDETGPAGVMLALLDRQPKGGRSGIPAQAGTETVRAAQGRHGEALEGALLAKIRTFHHGQKHTTPWGRVRPL